MKFLGCILLFFCMVGSEAYAFHPLSCQALFVGVQLDDQLDGQLTDEQTLLEIIKIQKTDRTLLFGERPQMSVATFIDEIIRKKQEQLALFRLHDWSSVPVMVREHYAALFEASVNGTSRGVLRLHEFPNFSKLTLEQLIYPEPNLEPVSSAVVSFMVQSNTVLAEFLAALHFPQVRQTETSISNLINAYDKYIYAPLRYELGEDLWANFLNRKMDLISEDAETYYWVEVKYLGRHKRYTSVSGADVYAKLKNTKALAQLLPVPIRVILAVAGPGWLSADAIKDYEDLGVEVVSLTPNWQP